MLATDLFRERDSGLLTDAEVGAASIFHRLNQLLGDTRPCEKAADFVGTNLIIGMHYDTFPYIEIDKEAAVDKAKKADKELKVLKIGEKITL